MMRKSRKITTSTHIHIDEKEDKIKQDKTRLDKTTTLNDNTNKLGVGMHSVCRVSLVLSLPNPNPLFTHIFLFSNLGYEPRLWIMDRRF